MPKDRTIIITFKDADFGDALSDAGVTSNNVKKLQDLAEFGEYWALEITMKPDGSISQAEFLDNT